LNWKDLREGNVSKTHATLQSLVKATKSVLLKQRKVIRACLTNLEIALPATVSTWSYKVAWWKYLTDIVLSTGRSSPAVKEWKAFAKWVVTTYFGKVGVKAELNPKWPKLPEGTWMTSGEWNAIIARQAAELSVTRNFPAADNEEQESKLLEFIEVLTTPPLPISVGDLDEIRRCSRIAGQEVFRCAKQMGRLHNLDAHVSLTGNGCYENPSSSGGKFTYVEFEFSLWLKDLSILDGPQYLPTGDQIDFRRMYPNWTAKLPREGTFLEGELGDPIPNSGWINPTLNGYQENRLSILLWFFSYLRLKEAGYIDQWDRPTGKMFTYRACVQGEPGNKARIPTAAMAYLTIYLQPYAHIMRAVLESDPTLYSGLSGANQAFEYVKRFEKLYKDVKSETLYEGYLHGDLETSTDYIEFEAGRAHMESFLEGFGNGLTSYIKYAHEFILQSYYVETTLGDFISCRGALMGTPGTKIILHTISKAVDVMASQRAKPFDRYLLSRHGWVCAGDDIFKPGNLVELSRYKPSAILYRVKPSEDKWDIYAKGGKYCERLMLNMGYFTSKVNEMPSVYVDFIQLRLLSPETKSRTGDEDTNPIFGKGFMLAKELEWFPDKYKANLASWLFKTNMKDFGNSDTIFGLPRNMGGLGLTLANHDLSYSMVDPWVKKVCLHAFNARGTIEGANIVKQLSLLRRPLLYDRGEPIDLEETKNIWVEEIINFGMGLSQEEAMKCGVPWQSRWFDQQRELKAAGWLNLTELLFQPPERIPYWDRKKPQKGWKTAPFSLRLEALKAKMGDLHGLREPTLEEWIQIHNTSEKEFKLAPLWIPTRDLCLFNSDTGVVEAFNVSGRGSGLSLSFSVANHSVLWTGGVVPIE